jgi:hypothetical protein
MNQIVLWSAIVVVHALGAALAWTLCAPYFDAANYRTGESGRRLELSVISLMWPASLLFWLYAKAVNAAVRDAGQPPHVEYKGDRYATDHAAETPACDPVCDCPCHWWENPPREHCVACAPAVDHVDGDPTNNDLSNVRVMKPRRA